MPQTSIEDYLPEVEVLASWDDGDTLQVSVLLRTFRLRRTASIRGLFWRAYENGILVLPASDDISRLKTDLARLVSDSAQYDVEGLTDPYPRRSRHMDAIDAGIMMQKWLDVVIASAGPHPHRNIETIRHEGQDGSTTIFWFNGRPVATGIMIRDDRNYTILVLDTEISLDSKVTS